MGGSFDSKARLGRRCYGEVTMVKLDHLTLAVSDWRASQELPDQQVRTVPVDDKLGAGAPS